VYLDLHVKVKTDWRDDGRVLDEMGVAASHVTRDAQGPRRNPRRNR
jgi:hypothetical protein